MAGAPLSSSVNPTPTRCCVWSAGADVAATLASWPDVTEKEPATVWTVERGAHIFRCTLEFLPATSDWDVRMYRDQHLMHAWRWPTSQQAMRWAEDCRRRQMVVDPQD